jgi:integrase
MCFLPKEYDSTATADEKARMLAEAAKLRSKNMYPAPVVDLNCGLRDTELREPRWQQIDLVHKKALTVGKSKTAAGNRHTLVTELAEGGAGDEVIMSIAGHVSRAMLSRYSHVRMEAKRCVLDEIATRQRAADEKRKAEVERQKQVLVASQPILVQWSPSGKNGIAAPVATTAIYTAHAMGGG